MMGRSKTICAYSLMASVRYFHFIEISGTILVGQWCWVTLFFFSRPNGRTGAVGAGRACQDIFLSPIMSLFFLPLSGRLLDID